jgi:hypothetical protein
MGMIIRGTFSGAANEQKLLPSTMKQLDVMRRKCHVPVVRRHQSRSWYVYSGSRTM